MLSCSASVVLGCFAKKVETTDDLAVSKAAVISSMVFLSDFGFNIAHWVFSYKYYKIQKIMPTVQAEGEVSEETKASLERTNKIFIAINTLLPLSEGVIFFFALTDPAKDKVLSWVYMSAQLSVCTMQIVSGCFLAYGIFKIRQQATEDDTRQMNVPQLIYHVMVFGLYLAVNVTTLTIVAFYET